MEVDDMVVSQRRRVDNIRECGEELSILSIMVVEQPNGKYKDPNLELSQSCESTNSFDSPTHCEAT